MEPTASKRMDVWPWLLVAILVGGGWKFAMIPNKVMLTQNCQPDGILNTWRAGIMPERWRQSQSAAIERALQFERQLPRILADANAVADNALAEVQSIIKNSGISMPPKSEAEFLRERADEAEARDSERILSQMSAHLVRLLTACQQELKQRRTMGRS